MRITLPLVALVLCAAHVRAQTLLQQRVGSAGMKYGAALHMTADQNNDGYYDVLVGAPGTNGGKGSVHCLSGKFIATGVGNVELWSIVPSLPNAAGFGSAIIEVASLTGDISTDFLIGAPDYKAGLFPTGALFLIDGATHTIASTMVGVTNTRTGASLAAVGDQDADGKIDVATTAQSTSGGPSRVYVIRGSSFGVAGSVAASTHSSLNANGAPEYGAIVASGFDLDHDGRFDLAIGSPDFLGYGTIDVVRADGSFAYLGAPLGQQVGERFGASIDGARDFDGDGFVDLVVGAPNWNAPGSSANGRVFVVSGAMLLGGIFPPVLRELHWTENSNGPLGAKFGASVRACEDLNGDGTPDIVVGAPDYATLFPPVGLHRGAFAVFSGATGARIGGVSGAVNDMLGDVLLDLAYDFNGDGFRDIGVAASSSDSPATDSGRVSFYSIFPGQPLTYCTPKVNSIGCAPTLGASGLASVSSAAPFNVTCGQLINQKSGLYMYSHAPNSTPFQGGILCVHAPLRRTAAQNSGGSTTGSDCTGFLSFDFNARIQSGSDPTLVVGAEVFTQVWSRDPGSGSATSLSNGMHFLVGP